MQRSNQEMQGKDKNSNSWPAVLVQRDRNGFNKYIRKRETPMQIIIFNKIYELKIFFKC